MDPQTLEKIKSNELRQRELQRLAHDVIRVYNPLEFSVNYGDKQSLAVNGFMVQNGNFIFLHDGYANMIPSRGYKDIERYKARGYHSKIVNFMLNEMSLQKGTEILEKRKERGMDELDKYQENRQIWDKASKLSDKDLREKLTKEVLIGLVEEYGKQVFEMDDRIQAKSEVRNVNEQIFDNFSMKRVEKGLPGEQPIVAPLKKKNE